MTSRALFAAAALIATVVVAITRRPPAPPHRPAALAAPVVSRSATAADAPVVGPGPSPLTAARRALHWQLAAEAGRTRNLPRRAFTYQLARELVLRPPGANGTPGHLAALREQTPIGSVRRVLATVRRGHRAEHITVLVVCRRRCLVAGIE